MIIVDDKNQVFYEVDLVNENGKCVGVRKISNTDMKANEKQKVY